ncbi:hypothetical protein SLS56_010009 [Neofusicoccum ribis]|uniref:Uncharacterized protein n=1 Tax=Neofusicoccum ribis TaxID=45134 RepID=A0ABR3SGJ5_9PEZI
MQAMLNGALLEVGHSMKNPERPKLTFPSAQGIHGPKYNNMSISASYERFHHCLDDLEHELSRAKAVLRRDLAVQREEREKREKAEQERAAEAAQKIAAEKKAAAAPVPAPAAPPKQEQQQKDVDMSDAPAAATNSSKPAADAPSVAAHTHLPPRPPAIQTSGDASAQPVPATATTDDLFGRTPTTAGINNADFDSMFEDFANSNDNDNAGGDTGDGVNDEFDFALLPGLESYANSDNNAAGSNANKDAAPEIDFSVLDNNPAQDKAKEEEEKKKQEEEKKRKEEEEKKKKEEEEEQKKKEEEEKKQQEQQQQDDQDPNDIFQGDSTFDDLFNYTDFDMGAGGSTGGGDTTFDDDFFNI